MLFVLLYFIAFAQGHTAIFQCPPSKTSIENSLYDTNIPGLVAIVVNSTHILYEQAFGYNAPPIFKERQPIDSSKTIFVLASISKTFIGVAAMQLVELHQLDLDKDINEYLPSHMKVIHPFYPNISITMRHVLSHTSGIGPNVNEELKLYVPNDDFTKTNLSSIILSYINNKSNWLSTPPGTVTHHSNIGAALAALIVEQIAQISFEQYVQEKILQPLGISKNDAGYRLSDFENRKQDLIEHYLFNASWLMQAQNLLPQLNIRRVDSTSDWLYIPRFGVSDYPTSLLRMSAHSLAKYLQSFLNDFWLLLLNPSSANELIRINLDDNEQFQFGLLWHWETVHGRRFVGHRGSLPGVTNIMMANEKRTLGVIILSNGDIAKLDDLAKTISQTIINLMITLFNCFE
ncbi:unnamed protein product [Rotaria sp. Silwood2]|nr:unnamed protein product [Rotaria sp. Silwood2]